MSNFFAESGNSFSILKDYFLSVSVLFAVLAATGTHAFAFNPCFAEAIFIEGIGVEGWFNGCDVI